MFFVTGMSVTAVSCLVAYAFVLDGTAQRLMTLGLHLGGSLTLSVFVLMQCTFLYEHYTQMPAFPVVSSGFGISLFLLWNFLYLWPGVGGYFLAGGALGTFIFSVLGLQSKPGTIFPLVFLPICSGICYLSYGAAATLGTLLLVSLRDVLASAVAAAGW